ncbi:conserved protein of unknown function (plasmid) [Pseudodesulfovibrio profundus]|uniref:Conjugal transfer protein TraD n=1 Tax=Pseudodesulfovibrio profundus TaxID=57320 RepID=A0A2C8FF06_9BACT|nr:conjugal transfer protein TraD [Pseudodesulfovibrio profundus]SOB62173.1 conserved protein of unknown function [Pseudodesulfovibrio profundus]
MASLTSQFKEKYPHMTDKEINQLVKLHNREAKAKEQQRKLRAKASKRKRKERTKLLCDLGGLVLKSGLENMDRATLLGALLAIKKSEGDSARLEAWKFAGTEAMGEKESKEVKKETSTQSEVIQKPFGQ